MNQPLIYPGSQPTTRSESPGTTRFGTGTSGLVFEASDEEVAETMLLVAAGDLQEEDIAVWLKAHTRVR